MYRFLGWLMWFSGLWFAAKFVAKHKRKVTLEQNNRWATNTAHYDRYPYRVVS